MTRLVVVAVLLAGLTALATGASAGLRIPLSSPAETAGSTDAPRGWRQFCPDRPAECKKGDPARIVLDAAAWELLRKVNGQVNETIQQVKDFDHWGIEESWDLPFDGKGDCEDLALEKRHELVAAGMPTGALLMTVVRDPQGGGHAVLTVVTNRGDFVLDNLTSRIKPWRSTGYGFIKRQSPENPNVWLTLRDDPAPVAVAATQP